jgi:hypothetical protein
VLLDGFDLARTPDDAFLALSRLLFGGGMKPAHGTHGRNNWMTSKRDTGMRRHHTERSALTPLTRTSGRGPGFAKLEAQEEWLGSVRAGLSKECASSALDDELARHRHAHRPLHGHAGMPLDGIERASVKAHPRQRRCGVHGPVTTALWSQTREI